MTKTAKGLDKHFLGKVIDLVGTVQLAAKVTSEHQAVFAHDVSESLSITRENLGNGSLRFGRIRQLNTSEIP
ncbi:hypothetical protein [Aporhodopirellula aestuarii]|uniref:hypothetical protein n=1 Tax=Aporhodopirellula aestuarii TaxID=2950107 RepID=UPI0020340EC3|nr:hypothetical protein [Aporhodopirellula aestuarii]